MPITMTPPPEWKANRTWIPVTAIILLALIFGGPPLYRWIKKELDEYYAKKPTDKKTDFSSLSDDELWDLPKDSDAPLHVKWDCPLKLEFSTTPRWSPLIITPDCNFAYQYRVNDPYNHGFAIRFASDGKIFRFAKGRSVTDLGDHRGEFRILGFKEGQIIQVSIEKPK